MKKKHLINVLCVVCSAISVWELYDIYKNRKKDENLHEIYEELYDAGYNDGVEIGRKYGYMDGLKYAKGLFDDSIKAKAQE